MTSARRQNSLSIKISSANKWLSGNPFSAKPISMKTSLGEAPLGKALTKAPTLHKLNWNILAKAINITIKKLIPLFKMDNKKIT